MVASLYKEVTHQVYQKEWAKSLDLKSRVVQFHIVERLKGRSMLTLDILDTKNTKTPLAGSGD